MDKPIIEEIHEKRVFVVIKDREIKDLLLRYVAEKSGLEPYTPDKGTRVYFSTDNSTDRGLEVTASVTIVNSIFKTETGKR
jgi:hypothetical protein